MAARGGLVGVGILVRLLFKKNGWIGLLFSVEGVFRPGLALRGVKAVRAIEELNRGTARGLSISGDGEEDETEIGVGGSED